MLNLQVSAYYFHVIFFHLEVSAVSPSQTETFNGASWCEIILYAAQLVSGLGY